VSRPNPPRIGSGPCRKGGPDNPARLIQDSIVESFDFRTPAGCACSLDAATSADTLWPDETRLASRALSEEGGTLTKKLALLIALVAVLAIAIGPARAVTDGELDGNRHPYVGLMVAQDAKGKPLWRCSGTLLSSKLFLTAGHCTEAPAAHVEIWFASDVESGIPENGYPNTGDVGGTPATHPSYDPNAFYLYDLGVVVLDKPMRMSKYGALPRLNELDALSPSASTIFTAVGYGLQKAFPDAASWKEESQRVRMLATPHLVQINTGFVGDFSIMLSNNASTGGTCFGDSGGPNFIGTSNVVGGVTSYGLNGSCAGTGGVYRVDRADDLNWLYDEYGSYL
jgi:Trypsin